MIKFMKTIAFLLLFLALAMPLSAVELEPQRIELSLPKGETATFMIKASNWLDYPVKITVKADSYRYMFTENTIPPAGDKNGLPSCEEWLNLEPNQFELSPKASIYVKCIIKVPSDAKEEHVASILFDEEGLVTTYKHFPAETGNITLDVVPRFTTPVYITIKGNEKIDAEIQDMKITEGPAMSTVKTEIMLHNTGTVHIRPSGNLIFMDSKGNIVRTLPIGEYLPIFPDYKEIIPLYYSGLFEPGTYTAVSTINIGEGKLLQKKATFTINKDYELE